MFDNCINHYPLENLLLTEVTALDRPCRAAAINSAAYNYGLRISDCFSTDKLFETANCPSVVRRLKPIRCAVWRESSQVRDEFWLEAK